MNKVELHIKTIKDIIQRKSEVVRLFNSLSKLDDYYMTQLLSERSSALIGLFDAQQSGLREDKSFDGDVFIKDNKKLLSSLDAVIVNQRYRGKCCIQSESSAMITWMKAEGCFREDIVSCCTKDLDKTIEMIYRTLREI